MVFKIFESTLRFHLTLHYPCTFDACSVPKFSYDALIPLWIYFTCAVFVMTASEVFCRRKINGSQVKCTHLSGKEFRSLKMCHSQVSVQWSWLLPYRLQLGRFLANLWYVFCLARWW